MKNQTNNTDRLLRFKDGQFDNMVRDKDSTIELLKGLLKKHAPHLFEDKEPSDSTIESQILKYNKDLIQLRKTYRGYWHDCTHEGFIVTDSNGERISDWLFEGQEFSQENLRAVLRSYPNAARVTFSTRLNSRSDEDENTGGPALDHAIMEFTIG